MMGIWTHYWGTTKHKFWVFVYLIGFACRLLSRAVSHDLSKYYRDEAEGFIRVTPKLRETTYGSDQYRKLLREIGPNIRLHYDRNSHHPEHFPDGYAGMGLIDFVEMFMDWRAAVRRHDDGDIRKSVEKNKPRFEMSEDVCSILRNTIGGKSQ